MIPFFKDTSIKITRKLFPCTIWCRAVLAFTNITEKASTCPHFFLSRALIPATGTDKRILNELKKWSYTRTILI